MTKIEWTQKTWNPIAGCTRISEGCRNCYAEKMTKRLSAMGQVKYQGLLDEYGHWNGKIHFDGIDGMDLPKRRRKPTMYFVNSMSDLFHHNVTEYRIHEIFKVMRITPQHTYQILTKRPERMMEYLSRTKVNWDWDTGAPLKNIWLGVSVENQQAADERIPFLLQTSAAVRFLSCEPLLGAVNLNKITTKAPGAGGTVFLDALNGRGTSLGGSWPYGKIDWVIAGGESGAGARPMHPEWVRSLRDQCQSVGVPFFFKQWGGVQKSSTGRELDGRTWDEMPG